MQSKSNIFNEARVHEKSGFMPGILNTQKKNDFLTPEYS